MIKTRQELIQRYVNFFKSKKHYQIPSASLIPENDPTVLFTTAGMHPLVPFFNGQKHPLGERLVSVQKCVRTGDIDEVGDEVHHTFFEMLGNWSLGEYWKEEAIKMSFEFLTSVLGLERKRLAITCFAGDENSPRDEESARVWLSLGIKPERMAFMGKHDNWWGPVGEIGPCGPDTEMFYWSAGGEVPEKFEPSDKRWVEIWNDVFMEFNKTKEGKYEKLTRRNVDTGMGVERTLSVLNGLDDNYLTSVFEPIIRKIEDISGKNYDGNENAMRVIADHVRAAVFILGDERGVKPGNVGQGYVLRRLIRRAVRYGRLLGIGRGFLSEIAKSILPIYPDYQELHRNHKDITKNLDEEENRFGLTLEKGLKKFNEIVSDKLVTGREAFLLFQSYGFPIEITQELALERGAKVDLEEYNQEFQRHQDLSRSVSGGQFKSGLADDSEQTRKLHTATHLLNEALRRVLGKEVKQKGSNITPERLRFDFNFQRKLSADEIEKIEALVNRKIEGGLEVKRDEVPLSDALESGAQAEFGMKYPDLVSVYTILDSSEKKGFFSKEICTGPHVRNTREIGKFKIVKEESSSAGVRRIKAVVE